MKTAFLRYIIRNVCKCYFTEIEPRKIRIKITHNYKWRNKRRICGIWKWNPLTIRFDDEYLRNADIMSIVDKVFHELMHVRLHLAKKQQPKNAREEMLLNKEAYRILKKLKKRDKDLIIRLTKK